ncbi:hypothetical protein EV426DRAFT_700996 [Tirmania nivea]|nr:hypothetical protein EV426DRAFT_700996 [Tirmania nivea]
MDASYNTQTYTAQTMVELFLELDAIKWYYKLLASVANWAMLAGFIVFPNAFDDDKSKFRIDADTLKVVAVCLLLFGYILTGILCWRFKNLLFQVESIFLPGFSSSTLGFMSSLFNVYGKNYARPEDQWSTSAILAVVFSSVFMVLYGATSVNANRKLEHIRKLDEYRRQLIESQEDVTNLTEEERTRRNLLALLLAPQQQGGLNAHAAAFEPTYTPNNSRMSSIHQSHSYPNTPSLRTPATTGSNNSATYLMNNYPAYSPPAGLGNAGVGRNSRDGLLPTSGAEGYSRWGPRRSKSSSGASTTTTVSSNAPYIPQSNTAYIPPSSTAYIPSSRRPLLETPVTHGSRVDLPHTIRGGPPYGQHAEKEVVQGPQQRKSIFAGISATVGHGRERVGAGWTSWSPV